jgi:hypothetical protein
MKGQTEHAPATTGHVGHAANLEAFHDTHMSTTRIYPNNDSISSQQYHRPPRYPILEDITYPILQVKTMGKPKKGIRDE